MLILCTWRQPFQTSLGDRLPPQCQNQLSKLQPSSVRGRRARTMSAASKVKRGTSRGSFRRHGLAARLPFLVRHSISKLQNWLLLGTQKLRARHVKQGLRVDPPDTAQFVRKFTLSGRHMAACRFLKICETYKSPARLLDFRAVALSAVAIPFVHLSVGNEHPPTKRRLRVPSDLRIYAGAALINS